MDSQRFDDSDRRRCLWLALVWFSYTALSILLVIALLTDWPDFLHHEGRGLGPW